MRSLLRFIFFNFFVRPLVYLWLGIRGRHLERLPQKGPAIVCANHNSHLDAMVLITLFPRRLARRVKAVAAADYFLKTKMMAWFSTQVLGIVPLSRKVEAGVDPLEPIVRELKGENILILFPEGSRGEPEKLKKFKSGIARLAKRYPDVPVYPVFMHGLGKSLPRGGFVLVPFFCDVVVGEPLLWADKFANKRDYMDRFQSVMQALAAELHMPEWES